MQTKVEMKEKWMIKVGHPIELYTKTIEIQLLLGTRK
jgi:hypothetical protein